MKYLLIIILSNLLLSLSSTTHACTVFYYSDDNIILAGNNEDWPEPFTKIWYCPAGESKYGVVHFGWDGQPQGGMNENGLFYDLTATPFQKVTNTEGRSFYEGNLIHKIMQDCGNIEETIQLLNNYNLRFLERGQLIIGDANGRSAIIEGDVIIYKKDKFQICTNFLQSVYQNEEFPCTRYKKVQKMLENSEINIALFRDILEETHEEGKYKTQYSNIYDLRNGIIYLYYFHDYTNCIKLDLKEELKKGKRTVEMHKLFPDNKQAESYREDILNKMGEWEKTRNSVTPNKDVFYSYVGKYKIYFDGIPVIISITTEKNKLYYSTTEFGKTELIPESDSNFFFVYIDGIYEIAFKNNQVITRSEKYSFVATKILN